MEMEHYTARMSPTVFKQGPYRFFFFSREEPRPHVHVDCADGEAKFWIAPVSLAYNKGLTQKQVNELRKLIEERRHEIHQAWHDHFSG
jgi:hypothetical protein